MRHNQNGRRFRGRGNNGGGGQNHNHSHNHGNNHGRRVNPRVQTFDSNGPDVRIRGNALQITEKYLTLARDAQAGGDRVLAESYLQHAEHYQRMLNEAQEEYNRHNPQQPQQQQPAAEDLAAADQPDVPMTDLDQGFLVGRNAPAAGADAVENADEQPAVTAARPQRAARAAENA